MSPIDYTRHKREKYADPSPYPKIRVHAPNDHYAEILMDDYAGMVSEFTAISQYLYHHFLLKKLSDDLGELLENVAITEMLHMEMLADTILLLGGNPVIRGSYSTMGSFWDGRLVNYGVLACDQLRADLDSEYKAIANYRRHIEIIGDSYVQDILKRIILDEEVHVKLFTKELKKYCVREK